ncbi:MAG: PIN domain-containing protein [Dehalococcoidia bacterium]
MGTVNACADSVILIDHLNGVDEATALLAGYDAVYASIISWIEVMAGARTPAALHAATRLFLTVTIVGIDHDVASIAAELRRTTRLKLPDAVILATARYLRVPLLTRNTKDFYSGDAAIIVPYRL